jgi:hypothetical protein
MALRKIFGPKRGEVEGGWEFIMEELHNLYALPNTVDDQKEEDEMGMACDMHGEDEKCIQDFDQKTSRGETTWKVRLD